MTDNLLRVLLFAIVMAVAVVMMLAEPPKNQPACFAIQEGEVPGIAVRPCPPSPDVPR